MISFLRLCIGSLLHESIFRSKIWLFGSNSPDFVFISA